MDYLYSTIEPTRLYVKQCPHCGLKYFGKTTKKNVESYKGSGVHWTRHLKSHNVKPTHVWNSDWYYDTSVINHALKFSIDNDIVESSEWANLIVENGLDGGDTSTSEQFKHGIRTRKSIVGINNPMYGRSAITEKNLKWYTNGISNIYLSPDSDVVPLGYYPGRNVVKRSPHTKEHKLKISASLKGNVPPNRLRVLSPDNKIFNSIREAADHCELTVAQFRHRNVNKGLWIIL